MYIVFVVVRSTADADQWIVTANIFHDYIVNLFKKSSLMKRPTNLLKPEENI